MSITVDIFNSLPSSDLGLSSSGLREVRRQNMGRLFAFGIREARKGAGLSIEQAAHRSGMKVSEWTAIEEGQVPQDVNQLAAMIDALEIGFDKIANLVLLCQDAWEA